MNLVKKAINNVIVQDGMFRIHYVFYYSMADTTHGIKMKQIYSV